MRATTEEYRQMEVVRTRFFKFFNEKLFILNEGDVDKDNVRSETFKERLKNMRSQAIMIILMSRVVESFEVKVGDSVYLEFLVFPRAALAILI